MAGLTEIYSGMLAAIQSLSNFSQAMTTSSGTFITALGNLNTTLTQLRTTGTSTTVPSSVGALTFTSSQPVSFLITTTSSGATVKIPFYNL